MEELQKVFETNSAQIKAASEKKRIELEEQVKKTQEKISTLNNSYESLNSSYKKWEKYRHITTEIYKYKGVFENLLSHNIIEKESKSLSQ